MIDFVIMTEPNDLTDEKIYRFPCNFTCLPKSSSKETIR